MGARDLLADARALLGATSQTSDVNLRLLYLARARATLAQLRDEVDIFGRELDAVEQELGRLAAP